MHDFSDDVSFFTEHITPWSYESIGSLLSAAIGSQPASTAWPSANRAIFVPFRIREPQLITQIVIGGGSSAGGNFDVGIYDIFGNLLVSSGSTAKQTSAESVADITDTLLGRGTYYMAMSADGTNNYIAVAPSTLALVKACGVKEMDTAFTLPSTATLATLSTSFVPSIALYRTAL